MEWLHRGPWDPTWLEAWLGLEIVFAQDDRSKYTVETN